MPIRVLVVSVLRPSPDADSGGGRSFAWRMQALANEVALRVLHIDGGEGPTDVAFHAVPVPRDPPGQARTMRLLWGWARGVPGFVAGNHSDAMDRAVAATLAEWRADVVQFDHVASAQWARALARRPRGSRPALVLVDQDPREAITRSHHSTGGYRTLRQILEGRAWRRWSRIAPSLVDAVVVFTDEDRSVVLRACPGTRVEVIAPTGPHTPAVPVTRRAKDARTILFVGHYDHAPNVDAARRLVERIFPAVRARVPNARLIIAGSGDPQVREDPSAGIRVTGWVQDLDALRREVAVEAMPIRLGGGVRVKVVDALRAGSAIVATPLAVEGIDVADGTEIVLADRDDEFATRIGDLILDPARRAALEAAAAHWARAHRPPDSADAYLRLYESLGAPQR